MSKKRKAPIKASSSKTLRPAVADKVIHVAAASGHADVARRAYDIYLAEGRPEGRHVEHWLRAEAELAAR